MPLLNALLEILRAWTPAFAQSRSGERAADQALGSLLALGRRTLSRSLWALGRQDRDWSADYKLHSRAGWKTQDLFQPVLQQAARFCSDSLLVVAMDDTRIRKTGRKILTAFYQRDPLSPKFRFNLMWGLRFLHFSLLLPLYRSNAEVPPRSLPVRFLEAPAIKKPGKRASAAEIQAYQQAVKEHNLSRRALILLQEFRQSADAADLRARTILAVGDGSFCNRTLFRQPRLSALPCRRAGRPPLLLYRAIHSRPDPPEPSALAAGPDLPRRTVARHPLQGGFLCLLAQRWRPAALAPAGSGARALPQRQRPA
jgi:hypothetical protein